MKTQQARGDVVEQALDGGGDFLAAVFVELQQAQKG